MPPAWIADPMASQCARSHKNAIGMFILHREPPIPIQSPERSRARLGYDVWCSRRQAPTRVQ